MARQIDIEQCVLGKTAGIREFADIRELRHISNQMLRQARRRLVVFSRDLDAPVFDQQPFLNGVKQLALSSRHARVQVLIQDNAKIIKQGHRLVELARRLSDTIVMRKPHPDYLQQPENFMLVDRSAFVYRKLASRYQGTASFHDPLENQRLAKFFGEMWESSEPDPELRRLYI